MAHGTEKRLRTSHITVRLTPDERRTLDAYAERAGLTAGSYLRQVLLGAPTPRQIRRPPIERRELGRLLGELGRVGNNINQLARAVNSGEEVEVTELTEAMASLAPVRHAILLALGRTP
jgi:hypothetical protein